MNALDLCYSFNVKPIYNTIQLYFTSYLENVFPGSLFTHFFYLCVNYNLHTDSGIKQMPPFLSHCHSLMLKMDEEEELIGPTFMVIYDQLYKNRKIQIILMN